MSKPVNVDQYISEHPKYRDILVRLRGLALSTDLQETIKWGMPTYTIGGKNVIGICAFKNHGGIWFFQGALLKDHLGVLQNAQEGKTHAMRHWKFNDIAQINEKEVLIYMLEAIENQKKGKRVDIKQVNSWDMPELLAAALKKNKKAGSAFGGLTPGRQKEYAEYISSAKREATQQARLDKILPMIESGIGLNDHYR